MGNRISWITAIKQCFKPKEGTHRWYTSLSTAQLKEVREKFCKVLFDPNEDLDIRWHIRDKILPYIDRMLREREK